MAASAAGAPHPDHEKKKKIELVSIPPFFRCPISLDLMRDPVSLCNGVTYDRPSIEAWFDRGNKTCPATMDLLPNQALTPNHTLRRLIQEWCVANRSLGIERIPTPKAPADPSQVRRLLHHLITEDTSTRVQPALKELRNLAKDSLGNAICIVQNGAPTVLASFLASDCVGVAASDDVGGMKKTACVEEALHILSLLPLDEQAIEVLTRQDHVAPALAILLNQGSMEARADVATLVERLAVDERRQAVMGAVEGITPGLVALLRDSTSFIMFPAPRLLSVEKVCLKALYALNLCRRNAAQTVDSGAVEMLIERLADADKDTTEASLALLELLCRSAEGRGAMVAHTLGVPMIVKKLLSASDLATEHALGALLSICSHSYVSSHHQAKQPDHSSPIRDAASSGACAKLCLLLQVQCTPKARTRASKLLRLLHSSINNCPCSHDSSF